MQRQLTTFVTEKKNGVVTNIQNSIIYQPKVNFNGKGIKWYDDSKLLRKER